MTAQRRRLPKKRRSVRWKARIGGHDLYVASGEYEDDSLGEVWLDCHKTGSAFRGLLHCFAQLMSLALQYGVPLRVIVQKFRGVGFEPAGLVVGHERIKEATSLVDYVVRVLACEYLDDTEAAVGGLRPQQQDIVTPTADASA